jgi:hypothetical protein
MRKSDSDAIDQVPAFTAGLEITKVVREFVPLKADIYGRTFGELIDEQLREAIDNHNEVQAIQLMFEREQWHGYAQAMSPPRS